MLCVVRRYNISPAIRRLDNQATRPARVIYTESMNLRTLRRCHRSSVKMRERNPTEAQECAGPVSFSALTYSALVRLPLSSKSTHAPRTLERNHQARAPVSHPKATSTRRVCSTQRSRVSDVHPDRVLGPCSASTAVPRTFASDSAAPPRHAQRALAARCPPGPRARSPHAQRATPRPADGVERWHPIE